MTDNDKCPYEKCEFPDCTNFDKSYPEGCYFFSSEDGSLTIKNCSDRRKRLIDFKAGRESRQPEIDVLKDKIKQIKLTKIFTRR